MKRKVIKAKTHAKTVKISGKARLPNPWMIASIILFLGLVSVAAIALNAPKQGVNVQSALPEKASLETIKQKTADFVNKNILEPQGLSGSVKSIEKLNGVFLTVQIQVMQDGNIVQEAPVIVTEDGKTIIFGNVLELDKPMPAETQ